LAIARACIALQQHGGHSFNVGGHSFNVIIVTDECNEKVFAACLNDLALPVVIESSSSTAPGTTTTTTTTATTAVRPQLQSFPPNMSDKDYERMDSLAKNCALYIACERAGPSKDGVCYTMRGIDMNARGFIAPLERLLVVSEKQHREEDVLQSQRRHHQQDTMRRRQVFIAIGDGGNELGMGKVLDQIINNTNIPNGEKIACVVSADYLIAASISNWGGYALAAGAAICRAALEEASLLSPCSQSSSSSSSSTSLQDWVSKCLPTVEDEIAMMNRGVAAGMRDGVTGKMEATVDGFPLETTLQCLRDIRATALTAFE
jgi:D-glutamate cyclase